MSIKLLCIALMLVGHVVVAGDFGAHVGWDWAGNPLYAKDFEVRTREANEAYQELRRLRNWYYKLDRRIV